LKKIISSLLGILTLKFQVLVIVTDKDRVLAILCTGEHPKVTKRQEVQQQGAMEVVHQGRKELIEQDLEVKVRTF